jgi:peptidylprolyl isomerase
LRTLCLLFLAGPLLAQEPRTITTPSGLKVEHLAEGKPGTAPVPGDRVKVHYTGWLADGKKFDSSVDRGEPFEFMLGVKLVIDGWDEGIALMNVGGKCKLHIPSKLAYGKEGRGERIPPNADLVFELELLDVIKGEPPPAMPPSVPERQKTTESGIKWEMLAEGTGDAPQATDIVKLRYFIWTTDGKFVLSSAVLGQPIAGPADTVRLTRLSEKFLPEAVSLMRQGAKGRFEVPPVLCWGKNKPLPSLGEDITTVWQLDLEEIVRFAKLDPEKTKKTASGLEYEVLREGTGAAPEARDGVAVFYTGWFEDGKEFDSAHRRGEPARFALSGVIPGWTEGLQLMKEGAICRFRIPWNLAYGEQGRGPIPAKANLVFQIELLKVLRK